MKCGNDPNRVRARSHMYYMCPITTTTDAPRSTFTQTISTDSGECCDPTTSNKAMGIDCREGETCCPNGQWVCNELGPHGYYAICDNKQIFPRDNPCDTTTSKPSTTESTKATITVTKSTEATTTTSGECCDPSAAPSANGIYCFEGETCCPSGEWVCNGGYDVHLGFFATCNGYNRITPIQKGNNTNFNLDFIIYIFIFKIKLPRHQKKKSINSALYISPYSVIYTLLFSLHPSKYTKNKHHGHQCHLHISITWITNIQCGLGSITTSCS